jgi:general secretion pathway protein G
MTTAAESPGTEVQRFKQLPWWDRIIYVVAVILGCLSILILAPIVVGLTILFIASSGDAVREKQYQAMADAKTLEARIQLYQARAKQPLSRLENLITGPENHATSWQPMMQTKELMDPWGEFYQYRNPGTKNPNMFDVYSIGPDKTEGTPDDVGNWQ